MRIPLLSVGLIVATLSGGIATAEPADFLGRWQQISSNAGECNTCTVTFTLEADGLAVRANNGWSAKFDLVAASRPGLLGTAIGRGRWEKGVGGSYSAKGFVVIFRNFGNRLVMQMAVSKLAGQTSAVRATFKRIDVTS